MADKQPLINNRNWGLLIGVPFTVFVVGLIVYGNFFASSSHPTNFVWEYRPVLYVCDTAPEWAQPDAEPFARATKWWEDQGWAFENIEAGPCTELCKVTTDEGETLDVTCNKGKVTLDLMDRWWDEDHAGVCRHPAGIEVMRDKDWATILVPNVILGSSEVGGIGEDGEISSPPMLPKDADALVLAHEIGHCLAGLGHNQGPPVGCARLNPKTGAMMNPNLYSGGWVDEAIPDAPEEW